MRQLLPHIVIPIVVLLAPPNRALAQSVEASYQVALSSASDAKKLNNYDMAIARLEEGLQRAEIDQNQKWVSAFHFQLALTLQERALTDKSREDYSRVIDHYRQSLAINPSSGSALNNLAQIYAETGRNEEATSLYERAIALDDERKGFYALNLADMLKDQGNPQAARYYRITLEEYPDHPDALAGLVAVYQTVDLPSLVTHFWDQIDKGREARATLDALQTLNRLSEEEDRSGLAREKTELLTCVLVGLSRAQYGPLSSEGKISKVSEIERMLQALAEDPDIGPGVKEILQAYDNPNVQPEGNSWWADKGSREQDPQEGWWPRDGYRMLLRSLGAWYERRDWLNIAEAYYRASIRLTKTADGEPDLEALVRLADIYVRQGEIERLRELLDASDTELFFGKGEAYKTSSWKKVYAFHRTLGIMYALTENWGDSDDITSATFQLENALHKRKLYNRQIAAPQNLPPIPLEPRLVTLLAQTYNATGRRDEAVQVQLDAAEELVKSDEPAGARQVLEAMDTSRLNRQSRQRYRDLQRRVSQ